MSGIGSSEFSLIPLKPREMMVWMVGGRCGGDIERGRNGTIQDER